MAVKNKKEKEIDRGAKNQFYQKVAALVVMEVVGLLDPALM